MQTPASRQRAAPTRRTHLRDAQEDHDHSRRSSYAGATTDALDADHRRWEAAGAAVANLALQISGACAASLFSDARPDVVLLTARLCESFDDLMDAATWRVIDAAARLTADERRG